MLLKKSYFCIAAKQKIMNPEVYKLVSTFRNILHVYSILEKKPIEFVDGPKLHLTEIQTVSAIGESPGVNITQLSEIMGVTRGAISQMVQKLAKKGLITRSKERNNKEINLGLSKTGQLVCEEFKMHMQGIFVFAEELYDAASSADRELAKRLFEAIYNNLRARI